MISGYCGWAPGQLQDFWPGNARLNAGSWGDVSRSSRSIMPLMAGRSQEEVNNGSWRLLCAGAKVRMRFPGLPELPCCRFVADFRVSISMFLACPPLKL